MLQSITNRRMERNVNDKIVVVTGGAMGIGLSITEKFLESGAKCVIILDIVQEEANEAVSELNKKYGEGKAVFIKCDVTKDLEEVSNKILNAYKTVDVLVNNAGFIKEDSIRDTLNLNVLALIEWSMQFFEHMRTDNGGKGGTIINMSSIAGVRDFAIAPYYSASKRAVLGFTKSKGHALNFAQTGVRMIVICPGLTKTPLTKNSPLFTNKSVAEALNALPWQDPGVVGEAAVQVFRTADSGTAWLIEGGNPIQEVF